MLLGFLAAAITLPLDAGSSPTADLTACFFAGKCRSRAAWVGDKVVGAGFVFGDADVTGAVIAVGDETKLTYFDAGHISSSTAHMSEDRALERYDDAVITAGTLADGSHAAVIRLDWSHQDYREGNTKRGLDVVWRGRWQKRADVVVCSLRDAPACSKPLRVGGRPKVSLRGGVLVVGREHYAIDPSSF